MSHLARVHVEKSDLDIKMEKLSVFLMSDKFKGLPRKEQVLLKRQHSHMRSYSEILGQRLATK